MKPRWLIFGVGNPSRGDDALGPLLVERLEAWRESAAELPITLTLLTDFQWQIEHALDLRGADLAIFVDASVSSRPPFEFAAVAPKFDATHSTHALSPGCVLAVAEQIGLVAPSAFTLAIASEDYALGAPLSQTGQTSLESAFNWLRCAIERGRIAN